MARRLVTSSMTSRDYYVILMTSQSSSRRIAYYDPDQLSAWTLAEEAFRITLPRLKAYQRASQFAYRVV